MTKSEYSRTEHKGTSYHKTSLIKDPTITERKIIQEKRNAKDISKLERKRK